MDQVSGADRSLPPGVHRRDLDKNQHGTAAGLGAAGPKDQGQSAAWSLADHDLPGRIAPRSHHCSLAHRWADQWRDLPALRREGFSSDLAARRHRDHGQSHKGKAVRRAIRAAGARLFYLPKYSPDLNPIEQFFAKFKHWLRKAARRTTDAVYNAIGPILDTVSAAECANYFANAGYDQT